MSELTTERLEKRIKNCIEVGNSCVMLPVSVAEELLAYRKTVNHLLDSDGSRGKFSAVQSYDAREDLERLLAPTTQHVMQEMTYMAALKRGIKTSNRNQWVKGYNAAINDGMLLSPAQLVSEPYKLPAGWKLVPEEATIAMLTLLGLTGSFDFMQQKYKNMLAAAPSQESE